MQWGGKVVKTILGLAALALVAVLVWNVGAKLSADAVGMGVGLIFGVLAGIPSALLVLATSRRQRNVGYDEEPDSYEAEWNEARARARAGAMPGQPPPIIVMPPRSRYTTGRPFAIVPAARQQYRCGLCNTVYAGDRCPGCGVDDFGCPITPEEAQQLQGRRFKVVGLEAAIYNTGYYNKNGIHDDFFDDV